MMRYVLKTSLLLAASLSLAACSGGETQWNGHDLTGVMPDLAYTLTGESGEPVKDGAHAGKVRALFFGYTHCPDICPITLSRLKGALQQLDKRQREQIRVLFVSVDPERDDPARLREYTDRFGPRFIGLTGTQDQLTELTKRYRVTYGYDEPNDQGFYTVSHSSGIFVFAPDGRTRLLFNQSVSAKQIAVDLEKLLAKTNG